MKVRVKEGTMGYYKHKRRREGEILEIPDAVYPEGTIRGKKVLDGKVIDKGWDVGGQVIAFASSWMEKVDEDKPEPPKVEGLEEPKRRGRPRLSEKTAA